MFYKTNGKEEKRGKRKDNRAYCILSDYAIDTEISLERT